MIDPTQSALISAALAAQQRAYARYSGFQVGAAVRVAGGQVYSGCNVENRSYGLTVCAERVAVFTAVAAGELKLEEMALVTPGLFAPCGACLQVLSEFHTSLPLILVDASQPDSPQFTSLDKLLPMQFSWEG